MKTIKLKFDLDYLEFENFLKTNYKRFKKYFEQDNLKVYKVICKKNNIKITKFYFFFTNFSNVYLLQIYSNKDIKEIDNIIKKLVNVSLYKYQSEVENLFNKYELNMYRYIYVLDKNSKIVCVLVNELICYKLIKANKKFAIFDNIFDNSCLDDFIYYCRKKDYKLVTEL